MPKRSPVALALLVPLIALAGCGSSSGDNAPVGPSESAEQPKSSAPPKTSGPVADACEDEPGDGGPVDLTNVVLTIDDGLLVVVEVAKALPTTDTAMIGINVASADSETSRQLAVKWVDGAPGPFVFDMSESQQENLAASALTVDGTRLRIEFPASAIAGLGEGWTWSAFSAAAGDDVDACPGAVGSFETKVFGS